MFYLRVITESQQELNFRLGESYSVIKKLKSTDPDHVHESSQFSDIYDVHFYPCIDKDLKRGTSRIDKLIAPNPDEVKFQQEIQQKVYAFISSDELPSYPLWSDRAYFVMTDGGKTFSNLTQNV